MEAHGCVGDKDRWREATGEVAAPVGLPMGDARTVKRSLGPIKGGMRGVKTVESGSGVPSEEH